ncbi:MAG: DMT family transporter [Gammaproteobacteria bacterium]|nr:DMT family transporter [Gammaproteobacteria bacterium]
MEPAARDNLKLAVSAILGACFALSLGDALIRQQSTSFVIWQIFVMRSVIVIPFLIYFVRLQSCAVSIKPEQPRWTLLRSLLLVLMWIFYFAALPHIELATAAAAYYTLPIFITLFAAIFLGESITARGWFALLLGFIGTLLILQPQADDFNAYALLPLLAAVCYAGAMILTRSKCRYEKPTVLGLWLNVAFFGAGAAASLVLYLWNPGTETVDSNPFLLGAWRPMWLDQWRIMAILAVAILVGSVSAAFAYQKAPSSIVAIFDFAYVAFAVIWGFLLFSEVPQPLVAMGIVAIVIAGIIATLQKSSPVKA